MKSQYFKLSPWVSEISANRSSVNSHHHQSLWSHPALSLSLSLSSPQSTSAFQVTLRDESWIVITLEPSDLRENVTAYAARVSGEPRTHLLPFQNQTQNQTQTQTQTQPDSMLFNASYHGLSYTVGLVLGNDTVWSKPVQTRTILTSKAAEFISWP